MNIRTQTNRKILLGSFLFLTLYGSSLFVFATPPTTPYRVSEAITDPACIPGATNCFVAILESKDEGTNLTYQTDVLNFVGSGVTATESSGTVTVTIPGSVVGSTVSGGTANRILYVDASGNLANSNDLEFTSSSFEAQRTVTAGYTSRFALESFAVTGLGVSFPGAVMEHRNTAGDQAYTAVVTVGGVPTSSFGYVSSDGVTRSTATVSSGGHTFAYTDTTYDFALDLDSAGLTFTNSDTSDYYVFPTDNGTSGQVLQTNGSGILSWANGSSLSGLTAASATNTINNADYAQVWQWNTLTSNTGLTLSSNSTTASTSTQKVFAVSTEGANASSGQTTYGMSVTNTHTGTTSTNVAGYFSASGGTNNYGLLVPAGYAGFGTATPLASTQVSIFGPGSTSSTYGLQVHNSTGTNNALVVRDDGSVFVNAAAESSWLNNGTLQAPKFQVHTGSVAASIAFNDNAQGSLVLFNKGTSYNTNTASLIINNHNNDGNAAYAGFEIKNSTVLGIPGWLTEFIARGTTNYTMMALGGSRINFFPAQNAGVGINLASTTTIPSAALHVEGTGTTSSTYGLQVHNSTGTNNALVVRDDTKVFMGATSELMNMYTQTLLVRGGGQFESATDAGLRVLNTSAGNYASALQIGARGGGSDYYSLLIGAYSTSYSTNSYLAGNILMSNYNSNYNAGAYAQDLIFNSATAASTDNAYIEFHRTNGNYTVGASTRYLSFATRYGNMILGTTLQDAGTSATKTFVIESGTAPSGNVADAIQMYSSDFAAGDAGLTLRTENGTGHIFASKVGIGTITPSVKLHVYRGELQIQSSQDSAGTTFATRSNSIYFSRSDLADTYRNKITNSFSGTPANTTMSFELSDSFGNTNVTALTLDGNGDVMIGTSTPTARLSVVEDSASVYSSYFFNDGNNDNRYGILIQAGADTPSAGKWVQFNDGDGGDVGTIALVTGTLTLTTTSDERLKQNITDTALSLDQLMAIKVRDFSFRRDESNTIVHGFIAQELAQVYPDAVILPQNPDEYWKISYSQLTPLVVKSVQELNIKITDLQSLDLEKPFSIATLIKTFLEDVNNMIDTIFARKVDTEEIQTDRLCVGETCVNEQQLLELLNNTITQNNNQNNQPENTQPSEEETIPETNTEEPQETEVIDSETIPEEPQIDPQTTTSNEE